MWKKKTLHPTQKEVEKIVKKNTRLVPVRWRIGRMVATFHRVDQVPLTLWPSSSATVWCFVCSVPRNRCKRSIHSNGWLRSLKWARGPNRSPRPSYLLSSSFHYYAPPSHHHRQRHSLLVPPALFYKFHHLRHVVHLDWNRLFFKIEIKSFSTHFLNMKLFFFFK